MKTVQMKPAKRIDMIGPPIRPGVCSQRCCKARFGLAGLNGCGCDAGQATQTTPGFSFDRDTKWILLIGAFALLLAGVKKR